MSRISGIILFVVILFGPALLKAQQSSILSKRGQNSGNTQSLIDSAFAAVNTNPSKSFDYIEKALSLSIKSGDKNAEALTYQCLGKINVKLGQSDLGIPYFQKAIALFESVSNKQALNSTYFLMAEAYSNLKNTTEALRYYNKYIDNATKKGDIREVIRAKNHVADLYYKTGNSQQAIKQYTEIKNEETRIGNKAGALDADNKIGQIYLETNQKDKALYTYQQTEQKAKNTENIQAYSNSLQQQSKIYRSNKQYKEELGLRNELLSVQEKNNNKPAIAETNLEIGNSYIEQNMASKAIPYINKSIKLTEETGNLEQKSIALQSLSAAYGKNQQFNLALDIYRKYVETVDALYRQKEENIKGGMQLAATMNRKLQRLDLIEKELSISDKTIDLLKQEQQVNQQGLKAQRIINFSLTAGFLILVITSLIIYRNNLQKRKANQMLALKSLRSQMNPHFIYNSLNSVNNYISKNDEKAANKYLSDFSRLMREVMENSKHDFITLTSEIEILDIYLKLEHTRFGDKFDYRFDIDSTLEIESYQVPPMLIQPFIENAIWHGLRYREEKGFLNVMFKRETHLLSVIVEDNGIGRTKSEELKTKNQKEHVSTGLRNIGDRIKIINELYHVKLIVKIEDLNQNGETGTRVKILIPVKK
jgi:two-component system, LytTR family, sensor kinase